MKKSAVRSVGKVISGGGGGGGGGSDSPLWWNSAKMSLSNYFTSQKYSLFDNETDEISTGSNQQQKYGSTGLSASADASPSNNSSYSLSSSLNLMSSSCYEPVITATDHQFPSSTTTKPDPVAVLPVSSSISSRHKGHHQEQLLSNGGSGSSASTVDGHRSSSAAVLSLSGQEKGQQRQQQQQSSGEYCLFSSQSLSLTSGGKSLTSGNDFNQHFSSSSSTYSLPPYFSLSSSKNKRPTRRRPTLLTVIMGVTSLALLLLFAVLLKLSYNANATPWAISSEGERLEKDEVALESASYINVNNGPPPTNTRVCQSEACREAGKALYDAINFTADPCNDFFEFACGNWNAKHPIPDDKSRVGTFNMLDDTLTENMRQILETPPVAAGDGKDGKDGGNSSEAKSVVYALNLYKECLDRDTIERLGHQPIQQQLAELLGISWPIVNPDDFEQREADTTFMGTFLQFYSIGFAPLITFIVQPDANQTTHRRIYFDSPAFGLGRKEYSNQTAYKSSVDAYRKYLHGVVALLAGKDANETLVGQRVEEIFALESKLALASTPPENRRSAEVWYNKMTLGDFKELTESRFDWTELLTTFTDRINLTDTLKLSDDALVIVEDLPYYRELVRTLDDTPNHVLYNYMGWMFANQFSKYAGKELQGLSFAYQKAQQGVKEQPPVWKRCVKQVYAELSWAVSRRYVDRFVPANTKQKATALISDLKAAFRQLVLADSWLDEVTRQRALEKMAAMRENVAYPQWILDNGELDRLYGFETEAARGLAVRPGRYFQSVLDLNRLAMVKMYRELSQPVNLTIDWPMAAAVVNAAFAPTQNSITIPAAILHPPFFDPGRPTYMNIAAIGAVIGHEITHGFDDQGQQFDKSGNLIDWWTSETKIRFSERAQCFVKQYGDIVDPETNQNLNGVNTVGENCADNGGVRQSHLAFRAYAENNTQLTMVPYLVRKFTPEQVFFLSYANVWCGSSRPEAKRIMIDYDVHSPVKYRVNVPLSNFEAFGKAFNCPAGSAMTPTKTCTLW